VYAESKLNRSALVLDLVCKAWPWVALAGLAPQLIGGAYERPAMAISAGGILLGSLALGMWADSMALISGAAIAWTRLTQFWQTAARTSSPGSAASLPILDRPAAAGIPLLELSSVTFRHANRERPTLREVTLAIREGDRILLGGRSGSGKSTLAHLITGGRPLQSGLLFFRGLDIATVGVENWRRRVMLAPQFHTNQIFSASLGYNLLLGRAWPPSGDDLTAAEIVCREVGLAGLIEKMPLGLDQTVGETGWQLSHGERTRVFLARVLLQEPSLMILDETFGALDPDTLSVAMKSVLARPGAVVVVAHT
jgi:ATP-binding cassette subfamily B protein